MDREKLEEPFPDSLVKTRRGAFGRTLSFVEGSAYIQRLNQVFEAEWSFEIMEHQIHQSEVIVLGKLTIGNVVKMAFGGSSITTNRESGELVSVADDMKSAATDALKKSCSLLGIGLHLYTEPKDGPFRSDRSRSENGANGRGNGNGHRRASPADRLTTKQLGAIWSLSRALGISSEQTRQRTLETFGSVPEQLTRQDASSLIGELMEAMNGPVEVAS